MGLKAEMTELLPKAIAWARKQEFLAKYNGSPLTEDQMEAACRVGVRQPDLIRLMCVEHPPQPDDPDLRRISSLVGLLGPDTSGLTLGYAIFIVRGHETMRLISHECRHVYQCEQYGLIDVFLPNYLSQVVAYGYYNAPLEVDARNHEILSL